MNEGDHPTDALIDLQINGWAGTDFSDPSLTLDAARECVRAILATGTAQCLPTMITAPVAAMRHNLPILAQLQQDDELGPHLPGLHIEGPFLDPGACGAHPPEAMLAPDCALLDQMQDWAEGGIRLLTVAAGLPGVERLIEHAVELGIVVSLGHHLAGYAAVRAATDAGARAATHLGNGLPHLVHRHDNPVLASLACPELTLMLIGDGHHVPGHFVDLVLAHRGVDGCILVSDAASVAGLAPGRYRIGHIDAELGADGSLRDPATGYGVGAGMSLAQCVAAQAARGLDRETIRRLSVDNPKRLLATAGHPAAGAPS